MASKFTFYTHSYPPEYWFLADILYWVAAQLLPEESDDGEGCEIRDSNEYVSDQIFELGSAVAPHELEPETTERMGLPMDPRWEDHYGNPELPHGPDYYQMLSRLVFEDDPQKTEENRKAQLIKWEQAVQRKSEADKWSTLLEDYLDQHISEILLDLRKGHLQAEGIRIEGQLDGERNEAVYEAYWKRVENLVYCDDCFEPVPEKLWVRRRVSFDGNYLEGDAEVYLWLRIRGDNILERYPPKDVESVSLKSYGGGLFSLGSGEHKMVAVNRGRPPKKWDAVSMKIAESISQNGGLPPKQDAFAQELVDWYRQNFKQSLGLSTVKARLKPYYNNPNFKKSEK